MTGQWWHKPWTLVNGCTPMSPACDNCWLADFTYRHSTNPLMKDQFKGLTALVNDTPTFNTTVRMREDRLDLPLSTRKPTVFAVWSDLFHEDVTSMFIFKALETMRISWRHTFIVLTKRPTRMVEKMAAIKDSLAAKNEVLIYEKPGVLKTLPAFSNVYFGVTVENQEQADKRLPVFLQMKGQKFLSIEPLLGPIDLSAFDLSRLDGVIVGGETGHKARFMPSSWLRDLRDQCVAEGVQFFFKGYGGGSKVRLLDGKEYNVLPWSDKLK